MHNFFYSIKIFIFAKKLVRMFQAGINHFLIKLLSIAYTNLAFITISIPIGFIPEPIVLPRLSYDWFILFFLVPISILFISLLYFPKYVQSINAALLNNNLSNKLIENRNTLFSRSTQLLNILFFIIIGLFIYFCLHFFINIKLKTNPLQLVLGISVGIFVFYQLKRLLSFFVSAVFNSNAYIKLYLHEISIVNMNMGILLIPIVFMYPFISEALKPFIIYSGLFIVLINYLIFIYKSYVISRKNNLSIFYCFLFFLFFELIPFATVYKISVSY